MEGSIDPQTSDSTLLDLRELSIRCRALLHQLSTDDGVDNGVEIRELKASFNIWAANMGVFNEGRQSLASRLKSVPKISKLVQQLLLVLQHDLGNSTFPGRKLVSDHDKKTSFSEEMIKRAARLLPNPMTLRIGRLLRIGFFRHPMRMKICLLLDPLSGLRCKTPSPVSVN